MMHPGGWVFCGWLGAAILSVTVAGFIVLLAGRYRIGRFLTPLYTLFAGCFLAVWVLMLPTVNLGFLHEGARIWLRIGARLMLALHNTLQVFTVDVSALEILDAIREARPDNPVYFTAMSVLMIVCPLLTVSFILSLLKNITAYLRMILRLRKDWFVFSELNEKALSLARDLRRRHRNAVVVFTDVFNTDDESSSERLEQAKECRAVCFKQDITTVNFAIQRKKGHLTLFAIGADESENVHQALGLLERYRNRENVRLYVFSTGMEGELLLNQADKGKVKVRRINEVRSLVNRLLYDRGAHLFRNAADGPDGKKQVSAVIVGLGGHGTQMLRSLAWFGQMDGYRIVIDAFDRDPAAEDRFAAIAPELMSPLYNGVSVPEEAEYTIRIHSGFDVSTRSFAEEIARIGSATYVFISLGSDALNIRAAADLRMLFERMHCKPVIHAVVTSSDSCRALTGITNYRGQPYDIDFVGDTDESFSEDVILNSALEADALARHLKWGKEEEFWQYEYNYNSSVASAIHMKARIACGIPGAEKREEDLTPEEADGIMKLEHRRWNAYMRSEGYVYSGSPDASTRNDLGKMHHNLVDFSTLSVEDQLKDQHVGMK